MALRGPAGVHSAWQDSVIPPTQFLSVLWLQALGQKSSRESSGSVRREGDGRKDRCGSGRFQIPSVQHSFLAKASSSAACEPEQAELLVGPGCSATCGVSCPHGRALSPGFRDSCTCRCHPLPRDRTEQSPGLLPLRLTVKAGRPTSQQARAE